MALAAGVSVGTVSHVLNRPELVSESTRSAVESAIVQLGYVPNHAARQLKVGNSDLIGFLYPNPLNPFYNSLAQGVLQQAERSGLHVFGATSLDSPERRRRYLTLFEQQRARGVIVSPRTTHLDAERAIADRGMPVVLVSAQDASGTLCSVSSDNVLGGRMVGEHLISAGRKRIVVISQTQLAAGLQRFAGVQQIASTHRDVVVSLMTVRDATAAAGRAATRQILALPPAERPDAILACSDLLAVGVLHELVRDSKFQVPHDIAVVGYDDLDFAADAVIPLTSVDQHATRLGEIAVNLLEEELTQSDHQHRDVVLKPVLVVRESSRG